MPKRAGYHHGDLKAALVENALALIAERGVAALSVAEVARRAQVSGGAPYRHFPNRQALLRAAAVDAAHTLTTRFEAECPWSGKPGSDPVNDLAATAAVYAKFTAENGIGFDLIFAAELRGQDDQELTDAGRAVMDPPLRAALSLTDGDAKAALTLVSRTFAAAHGHATLWRGGLYLDRAATVEDIAVETAAVARTLATAGRTT
ncbi:TetR/AcrR family transcriptional regulator [Umezawaea sp. NPDC059074]|uniref:TetR/AcrR family transcriptional regulator n=1 Tax=Umezawaea sp. NPDC059074 TaxID=3346716 RepID=UPI003697BAD5